jgi:hypothetical protein
VDRFGSDQERRRRRAQALYRFEMAQREEGEIPDFVYDEGQDSSASQRTVGSPSPGSGRI